MFSPSVTSPSFADSARPAAIPAARAADIPALNGIRAIACLLVLLRHAEDFITLPALYLGPVGMMMFFGLSGFLMLHLYGDQPPLNPRFLGAYAIRRIFRIYPCYLFSLAVAWVLYSLRIDIYFPIDSAGTFFRHALLLQGLEVYWSIPPELYFYMLFPVLLAAVWFLPKDWFYKPLFFFVFWLAAAQIPTGTMTRIALWNYVDYFCAGVVAAALYRLLPSQKAWYSVLINLALLISLAELCYFYNHLVHTRTEHPEAFAWKWRIFYSVLVGCVIFSAARCSGWLERFLSCRPLKFIGTVSFSLYLFHQLTNRLATDYLLPLFPRGPWDFPVLLLVAAIFASAVYMLVETPSRRFGKRLADRIYPLKG